MRNRKKGNRTEVNARQARPGVEDLIEHEMSAFVQPEPQQAAGKELHNVDRGVLSIGRRGS